MSEIKVGRPDISTDRMAHIPGVRQGNRRGHYKRQPGHHPDDTSTARRSTGVADRRRNPILPSMPNLSPA